MACTEYRIHHGVVVVDGTAAFDWSSTETGAEKWAVSATGKSSAWAIQHCQKNCQLCSAENFTWCFGWWDSQASFTYQHHQCRKALRQHKPNILQRLQNDLLAHSPFWFMFSSASIIYGLIAQTRTFHHKLPWQIMNRFSAFLNWTSNNSAPWQSKSSE